MPRKRLTAQERQVILAKVFKGGESVSSVCRQFGISRYTFYQWVKKYGISTRSKNSQHPRLLDKKREKLVLDLAFKNPSWSTHKISEFLAKYENGRYLVSNHGVQNVLLRHGLNTKEQRQNWAKSLAVKTLLVAGLSESERYQILVEASAGQMSTAAICRKYHISRYTFYEWKKRFEAQRDLASLTPQRPRGEKHFRYARHKIRDQVLGIIAASPAASVHKIHRQLAGVVGHHAIQNLLWGEGLNTAARRFLFAKQYQVAWAPVPVAPLYVPQIPLYRLRMLLLPFLTIPKLLIIKPKEGILLSILAASPILAFVLWLTYIIKLSHTTSLLGLILSSVALFFGLFFFVYSLSYYISIFLVLKATQTGSSTSDGSVAINL